MCLKCLLSSNVIEISSAEMITTSTGSGNKLLWTVE